MAEEYILHPAHGARELHIDYRQELNEQQYAAVTAGAGPMLVIAGAGSGKTRTLTYRVAWLVEHGVPPGRILLLTFTNKAAREIAAGAGLLMAAAMAIAARQVNPHRHLLVLSAFLLWILLVAPLSEFHDHLLALLPMTVLALLALADTSSDRQVTRVARIILAVYPVVALSVVVIVEVAHVGLLCWATLAVWGALVWIAMRPQGVPA